MAIRFDDRIETNVAGDVLITGDQIAVSKGESINIGTDEIFDLLVGSKHYIFPRNITSIKKLIDIPDAIRVVYDNIFQLSSLVISSALNDLSTNINKGVNIITTKKFLGDTIITSTADLNAALVNVPTEDFKGNPINYPIITLLSAPIQLSTRYEDGGMFYSTSDNYFPYGTKLEIIPKNTLIYISTTTSIDTHEICDEHNVKYNMALLSDKIQILSMPVSADSIHNNFETRIANIESLLALK